MGWNDNPEAMITQLQREARIGGNFVHRAILREIQMAFARVAGTSSVTEVVRLAEGWEAGAPDLQVLDAVRRINRSASCWKDAPPPATS